MELFNITNTKILKSDYSNILSGTPDKLFHIKVEYKRALNMP